MVYVMLSIPGPGAHLKVDWPDGSQKLLTEVLIKCIN